MTQTFRIAVLPGDGIGREVTPWGCDALEAVAEVDGGFTYAFKYLDWGSDYYLQHSRMMPEDALKILEPFDAIYFGAVGWPAQIPDHITLQQFLLPIRRAFEQYANVRPVRLLPGIPSRLVGKGPDEINFVVVRENTEGEYVGFGGRLREGTPDEVAIQSSIFTRKGTERVMRYAFELARTRRKKVTSATKSNACQYSMVLWDEVFGEVAAAYPDIETEQWHIDALTARFITHPETLDVVVASNLFGDILTDLGGALMGSMGMPPSANINPERRWPSLFEPVHGSAPDIYGQDKANPAAMVWAAAMMLEFLGQPRAADRLLDAVTATLRDPQTRPQDLGGQATCREVGAAICSHIRSGS